MSQYTFASWNVNSLRVRLPQLLSWLEKTGVDAVVLQETKLIDEQFPAAEIEAAGYDVVFCGQKTYNGVALLSKKATFEAPTDVVLNLPGFTDEQKRLVTATLMPKGGKKADAIRFIGGYIPNGNELGSWKYLYKLDWFEALARFIEEELKTYPRLLMGGDFNLAPEDRDVWDAERWREKVLTSTPERNAFARLCAVGLSDSYRLKESAGSHFSWWDYRNAAFDRNMGLRIDLLLVSDALKEKVSAVGIDSEPRSWNQPSDHTPVTVTIKN